MNKHQRYRQKCVSEGRCPHCGKPSAPFYECEERRTYKKSSQTLLRMVKGGMLSCERQSDGTNLYRYKDDSKDIVAYQTKDGDPRCFPRIGKQYIDIRTIAVEIIEEHGPLNIEQIIELLNRKIIKKKNAETYNLRNL